MKLYQAHFEAIGTHWQLQVRGRLSGAAWTELQQQITRRIETFDKAYSRFRRDSLVTTMAKRGGRHALPPDGWPLLAFYKKLYDATDGKVTPLIGQVMADAGYDAAYTLTPKALTAPPPWEEVIAYTHDSLTLQRPALLDFGAAGKGYLVDMVGALLEAHGLHDFLINAGGDILRRSTAGEALAVGMENPLDATEAIGILKLGSGSVCASAGSKRRWKGYHHLIDPAALRSPEGVLASWVLAADTMTADGLATALFFTRPEQLAKHFTFEWAVLYPDMSLSHSLHLPVQLFEAV